MPLLLEDPDPKRKRERKRESFCWCCTCGGFGLTGGVGEVTCSRMGSPGGRERRQPTSLEAEERFSASSNISLFARDIFKLLWAIASWVSRSVLAAAVTFRSVH